jgi:hypothetical protein
MASSHFFSCIALENCFATSSGFSLLEQETKNKEAQSKSADSLIIFFHNLYFFSKLTIFLI